MTTPETTPRAGALAQVLEQLEHLDDELRSTESPVDAGALLQHWERRVTVASAAFARLSITDVRADPESAHALLLHGLQAMATVASDRSADWRTVAARAAERL